MTAARNHIPIRYTVMRTILAAGSTNEAEKRAAKVVATRAPFDEVLSRLQGGRSYGAALHIAVP